MKIALRLLPAVLAMIEAAERSAQIFNWSVKVNSRWRLRATGRYWLEEIDAD